MKDNSIEFDPMDLRFPGWLFKIVGTSTLKGYVSVVCISPEGLIIPFCAYNLSSIEGESLYRRPGQSSKTSGIDRAERIKNKAGGVQTDKITQQECIESQTNGIFKVEHFVPSGCDHARCGFHGDFFMLSDGSVKPLTMKREQTCCSTNTNSSAVERNRNFVVRRWVRNSSENNLDRTETNPSIADMR